MHLFGFVLDMLLHSLEVIPYYLHYDKIELNQTIRPHVENSTMYEKQLFDMITYARSDKTAAQTLVQSLTKRKTKSAFEILVKNKELFLNLLMPTEDNDIIVNAFANELNKNDRLFSQCSDLIRTDPRFLELSKNENIKKCFFDRVIALDTLSMGSKINNGESESYLSPLHKIISIALQNINKENDQSALFFNNKKISNSKTICKRILSLYQSDKYPLLVFANSSYSDMCLLKKTVEFFETKAIVNEKTSSSSSVETKESTGKNSSLSSWRDSDSDFDFDKRWDQDIIDNEIDMFKKEFVSKYNELFSKISSLHLNPEDEEYRQLIFSTEEALKLRNFLQEVKIADKHSCIPYNCYNFQVTNLNRTTDVLSHLSDYINENPDDDFSKILEKEIPYLVLVSPVDTNQVIPGGPS